MRPILLLFLFVVSFAQAQELKYLTLNTDLKMASCVAFSMDKRLATASHDGKIYFWNVETQTTDNILQGHKDMVLAMSFSSDGKILATGGKDKEVLLWSVASGIVKHRLKAHTATITSLAFSYDDKYIASSGADNVVNVWDAATGQLVKKLDYHKKEVSSIAFAKSSHLLATGSYDGTVNIFDLQSGEIFKQFNPNAGRVRSVTFSPEGRYLAIGADDETVKLWELTTGTVRKSFKGHSNDVYNLEFSPDGKYLASGCLNNEVRIWSMEMAENVHTLKGFYKFLSLSFSKDGKYLAVADLHNKTRVYDIATLGIKPDPLLQKYATRGSKGLVAGKPVISILSPSQKRGEVIKTEERKITVQGNVNSEGGLMMLLVNGSETNVDAEGNFSTEVRLHYFENDLIVKAIDQNKNISEDTIHVYMVFDKKNAEEKAGIRRRGRDYALLIGTDEYTSMHKLSNPVNDINTVAADLEAKYGFTVDKILNPTLTEIYSAIRKYNKMIFSDDDQLFIMVAGHGEYDNLVKEGYLVAKDSKKDDEGKISYLSHSNLRTIINNIPCRHILLTLDVCFGGTFDQAIAARGADNMNESLSKDEFVVRKLKYKTRMYLTSGGKEYVPDGRPGYHSPFTRKVLDALRSNGGDDGVLTFSELANYVDKVVPEPRKGEFGDNEPGSDFLFIVK